jgi:hypothetical protein
MLRGKWGPGLDLGSSMEYGSAHSAVNAVCALFAPGGGERSECDWLRAQGRCSKPAHQQAHDNLEVSVPPNVDISTAIGSILMF